MGKRLDWEIAEILVQVRCQDRLQQAARFVNCFLFGKRNGAPQERSAWCKTLELNGSPCAASFGEMLLRTAAPRSS